MKQLVAFLLLSFLTTMSISAFAQQSNLAGIWELKNCEIRKDSVGEISYIDYQLSKGNIPQWYIFTELTFNEDSYCYLILNNDVIEGEYSLTDENILKLDFKIMIPTYNYTLQSDTILVLKRRHYLYNESNSEKVFLDIELSYTKK